MGFLTFETTEQMQAVLTTHGAEIMGDIPNYTNVSPLIQINTPMPEFEGPR
jgi:hypothetical protein